MDLKEIIKNFTFDGEFISAKAYGCGHINDTFIVYFKKADGQTHKYILQSINHTVFKNPEHVMENIEIVINHLKKKIIEVGGNPEREALTLIKMQDGKSFFVSAEGEYYRGYQFIENAHTYQTVENPKHLYNAGKTFGQFEKLLSDLPAHLLYATIADFHNTKKHFEALLEAVEIDRFGRVHNVQAEIAFATKRADDALIIVELIEQGKIPLRITHNDTKLDNIMIDDQTGEGLCVIDLDTVMPGSALYDFGDAVRYGANPASEGEQDLTKVKFELSLFEQFAKGFLSVASDFLTPIEVEYLPFSVKLMTFECGIRFLTDYLNGDVYFKIHRKEHNLDRARTQFKLVEDIESNLEQMSEIIKKYV